MPLLPGLAARVRLVTYVVPPLWVNVPVLVYADIFSIGREAAAAQVIDTVRHRYYPDTGSPEMVWVPPLWVKAPLPPSTPMYAP